MKFPVYLFMPFLFWVGYALGSENWYGAIAQVVAFLVLWGLMWLAETYTIQRRNRQ